MNNCLRSSCWHLLTLTCFDKLEQMNVNYSTRSCWNVSSSVNTQSHVGHGIGRPVFTPHQTSTLRTPC